MFNIGGSEMVLIGIVALLFLPPEKLPGIATQVGRFLGQLNHNFNEVKKQVSVSMKQEVDSIKKSLPQLPPNPLDTDNNDTHSPTNPR